MRSLSVAEYNQHEQDAMTSSGNRVLEALRYRPPHLATYPFRVESESELSRYIDVQHEGLFEFYFNTLLTGFTPLEYDSFQNVLGKLCDFTEADFGKVITARGSLLQAMSALRAVRSLFKNDKTRVMEILPYSAYAASLFQMANASYYGVEIEQAYYLIQNHLMVSDQGGKLQELAQQPLQKASLTAADKNPLVHIPWWIFSSYVQEQIPSVEVVLFNRRYFDLHPTAQQYFLAQARAALLGSHCPIRSCLFEGWGLLSDELRLYVVNQFRQAEFGIVHSETNCATFAPLCDLNSDESQSDSFISSAQVPVTCYSDQCSRSLVIRQQVESEIEYRYIPLEQLEALYTMLLGTDDHRSLDEKFWQIMQQNTNYQTNPPGGHSL